MRSMKKILSLLLVLVMILSLAACGNKTTGTTDGGKKEETTKTETTKEGQKEGEKAGEKEAPAKEVTLGVLIYDGADNYISTVKSALEKIDAEDNSIKLEIVDSQGNQGTQNDQLDALIAKKVDGLLVNVVDFAAGAQLKEKIKASGIPTVFWNRDITKDLKEEDLKQMIFFGTVAPQAGVFQGEIALDQWKANKAMDRNGDGKLQYVLLHGGLDNAEAVARSQESVKVFKDNGIETVEVAMQVAEWKQDLAKNAMDAWLAKDADKIEAVFANNDGMALGAIAALEEKGFNKEDKAKYIPVYGVDALTEAINMIEAGKMAGTVKQNNETMAKGIISLIKNKISGNDWVQGTDYKIYPEDKVSVRMDYEKVTK